MMIPKKRVSSGNCLHLRLELDSTNYGFQRAQRCPRVAGKELEVAMERVAGVLTTLGAA